MAGRPKDEMLWTSSQGEIRGVVDAWDDRQRGPLESGSLVDATNVR